MLDITKYWLLLTFSFRGAKLRGLAFNDLRKFSGSLEYAVLQAAEENRADFLRVGDF